jgi:multiple sugar transport system substrate-binding protein/sn-glycerol 3-phosphate transport system substrate-binding protein
MFSFVLLSLVGCASSPVVRSTPATAAPKATTAPKPSTTPSLPPELKADPKDLKGIQLRFYHAWTGAQAQQAADLVNQFNQSNSWGIHVQVTATQSVRTLFDLVKQDINSTEPPDVVAAPLEDLLALQRDYKPFVDLNTYVSYPGLGLSADQVADFLPVLWSANQSKNFRIGVPAFGSLRVLFYNSSWAKELGIPNPPVTPDDFAGQTCVGAAKDKTGLGGWVIDATPETALSWYYAFGGTPLPASTTAPYQFNNPQGLQMVTYLRGLFDKSCIWTGKQPQPYDYFAARQTLLLTSNLEDVIPLTAAMQRAKNRDTWLPLAFPTSGKPFNIISSQSYAIVKTDAKQQLAAWLFIQWLSDPQRQATMAATNGAIPAGKAAYEQMSAFRKQYPQWEQGYKLVENAVSTPPDAGWHEVRMILQDAIYLLLQPVVRTDAPPMSQILNYTLTELDKTIQDIEANH